MKEHKPLEKQTQADSRLLGVVSAEWLVKQKFEPRGDREYVYIIDKHEVVYALQASGNYKYDHTKLIEGQQ